MKKIFFIIFFVIVVFACEDREPEPVIVPYWLKAQLEELENSGECNGCKVQRWSYNEEYYYHLYCDNWSCIDCNVYHYDGRQVVWGEIIDPTDYNEKKHRPVIVWECGDDLE